MALSNEDLLEKLYEKIDTSEGRLREETRDLRREMNEETGILQVNLGHLMTTAGRHEQILDEHIRRTALAEANIERLQGQVKPLEKHAAMWAGAGKVLAVVGTIVGIVVGVLKLVLS